VRLRGAILGGIALVGVGCGPAAPGPSAAPNVVLILIDDLGWRDLGVAGSAFYDTPAVDRLAAEGVRFTQFYAASPVCSPTRASIMTGKHPARLGITNWIGGGDTARLIEPENVAHLPLDEVTLGEAFRDAGYATAYFGKWHLGRAGFMPRDQGFEVMRAVNEAGQPGAYFAPYRNDDWAITNVPDLDGDPPGSYLTDRLTDEAVRFLEEPRDRPFLLVLAHYAVHTPLQSKPDLEARYAARRDSLPADTMPFTPEHGGAQTKERQDNAVYAGMIASMDESVARVLATLDSLRIADRTIVVFVSDNGGLSTLPRAGPRVPTSNRPLRAGKGWVYEGGIRIPFIVRWPGTVPAGVVSDVPGMTTDLYPTLLELAGLVARPEQTLDGVSLAPVLRAVGDRPLRPLFWHFPHYHGSGHRPAGAVRRGRFKLVEWFETGTVELYDLAADPGESVDRAEAQPDTARALRDLLVSWRADVGARMPEPHPAWRSPTSDPPW
jgi:arylsulfatase A-like enzyme